MKDFRAEGVLSMMEEIKRHDVGDVLRLNNFDAICQGVKNYYALVMDANKKRNLIGRSTCDSFFNRHILDSAQLLIALSIFADQRSLKFFDSMISVADVGSGAGLPGMVFLIFIKNIKVCFVEKSPVKSSLLRSFIKELGMDERATVAEGRFEHFSKTMPHVDFLSTRAFKSIERTISIMSDSGVKAPLLSLKGRGFFQEIEEASGKFDFFYDYRPSLVAEDGYCVVMADIKRVN